MGNYYIASEEFRAMGMTVVELVAFINKKDINEVVVE